MVVPTSSSHNKKNEFERSYKKQNVQLKDVLLVESLHSANLDIPEAIIKDHYLV